MYRSKVTNIKIHKIALNGKKKALRSHSRSSETTKLNKVSGNTGTTMSNKGTGGNIQASTVTGQSTEEVLGLGLLGFNASATARVISRR